MAEVMKVLAQLNPGATTNTTLYTVPASTQVVVSSIVVANCGEAVLTYRIAIRPNGETLAVKHYLAYEVALYPGLSETATLGITLDAADVVTVRASDGNAAFNLFGVEVS